MLSTCARMFSLIASRPSSIVLRIQPNVTSLKSSLPTVGIMRSRHSRSVGKWIGVRIAAGVFAVSELMMRRVPVDRFTSRSVTMSAIPSPTALLYVSSLRSRTKCARNCGDSGHGLYSPLTPRFTTFVSIPAPLMFLPISSRIRMSRSTGILRHPGFHQRQVLLFALLHDLDRHRVQLRRIVIRVFQDRQSAQDLARLQHLPPDAADHVLEAQPVGVRMVALRSCEFAKADRHHLEQAALDLAGKIRVPFDAAHQHHPVGVVSGLDP